MNRAGLNTHVPGRGWLHRVDPRIRFLLFTLLASGFFFLKDSLVLGALFLALFPLCLSANLPIGVPLQSIRPFVPFFFLIFFFHGIRGLSVQGWMDGVEAVLRFALLVGLAALIPCTVEPAAMLKALSFFLRPLRMIGISHRHGAMMCTLALRFIPLLREEEQRRRMAQRARAYSSKGKPLSLRAKGAAAFYSGIRRDLLRRADEWAKALSMKAYEG